MSRAPKHTPNTKRKHVALAVGAVLFFCVAIYGISSLRLFSVSYNSDVVEAAETADATPAPKPIPVLDTVAYDKKMLEVANNPHVGTTTASTTKPTLWPVTAVYPKAGALLPFNRIVAYYGNFYSTQMGVLGQYPEAEMLAKLKAEVAEWQAADPSTPVIPAIDYIDITAQGSPGKDGKYRLRMPDTQIDQALALAAQVNGIVFLDLQIGLSSLSVELPLLDTYLKMPQVHLALDPEFAMKTGAKPGTVIGTMDAADINYAAQYLAKLVQENDLPPKILVIHRFTEAMVTNYKQIKPLPEVQMVMDMDGWGDPAKKLGTYNRVVYQEPVQFTGFKLFYKNDLKPPSTRMLSKEELLKLSPQPLFIQYQ